jgi:transposase
MRPDAV